jgi:predicted nucleic acid-binding protein
VKNILIDAGPIIALFNKNDQYHERILEFVKSFEGKFLSTWPVLTEAVHMLDFSVRAKLDFLKWVEKEGIEIYQLFSDDLTEIIYSIEKYSNVPMDLADASLIAVSEKTGILKILTIDRDYYIYRTSEKKALLNVLNI